MSNDEILAYLAQRIDLLQRKAVELQEQHDEISGSSAAPLCPGGLPLIYRTWDKDKGLQYQCPEKAGRAVGFDFILDVDVLRVELVLLGRLGGAEAAVERFALHNNHFRPGWQHSSASGQGCQA